MASRTLDADRKQWLMFFFFRRRINDNFINYIMWTSISVSPVSFLENDIDPLLILLHVWLYRDPRTVLARLCINVDNPTFLHFRSPHQLFEFIDCSDKLFDVINSVSDHSCSILLYCKINKRVKSISNKNI